MLEGPYRPMSGPAVRSFVPRARGATVGIMPYLALGILGVLSVQVIRSASIDANSLSASAVDLLGYLATIAFGLLLLPAAMARGRIQLPLLWTSLVLVLYIAMNALITRPELQTVPLLISRFGILLWLFVGMAVALALEKIRLIRSLPGAGQLRFAAILMLAVVMAYGAYFSVSYINNPVETLNYQMVANSAMTAIIIVMTLAEALWGNRKPVFLGVIFVAWGSLLTLAVAFTQSNSIIAFWFGTLIIYFYATVRSIGIVRSLVLLALAAGGLWLLFQSELFERLIRSTRLSELFYGTGGFSSVDGRLAIVNTFFDQFAIGPIFGHFAAEFLSGVGEGLYPHSLFLSFLTHTGLVGTTIWITAIVIAHTSYARQWNADFGSMTKLRLFWLTILYGSLATFLTWSLLWFILGMMCVRPTLIVAGENR